jgi:hypothetical protein|tara:strand:- start:118 stop:459 length:342 start_codon:yes stop_codon:yes gene_type:complete
LFRLFHHPGAVGSAYFLFGIVAWRGGKCPPRLKSHDSTTFEIVVEINITQKRAAILNDTNFDTPFVARRRCAHARRRRGARTRRVAPRTTTRFSPRRDRDEMRIRDACIPQQR